MYIQNFNTIMFNEHVNRLNEKIVEQFGPKPPLDTTPPSIEMLIKFYIFYSSQKRQTFFASEVDIAIEKYIDAKLELIFSLSKRHFKIDKNKFLLKVKLYKKKLC